MLVSFVGEDLHGERGKTRLKEQREQKKGGVLTVTITINGEQGIPACLERAGLGHGRRPQKGDRDHGRVLSGTLSSPVILLSLLIKPNNGHGRIDDGEQSRGRNMSTRKNTQGWGAFGLGIPRGVIIGNLWARTRGNSKKTIGRSRPGGVKCHLLREVKKGVNHGQ